MVTPKTGSVKKVQFYAAVALMVCGLQAGAAELAVPITEVQNQLTQKADQAFARKLKECRDREQGEEQRSRPHYPVRIAGEQSDQQRVIAPTVGTQLAAP